MSYVTESREYRVTVLARRSPTHARRWLALSLETGVIVQGRSLADVLRLAPEMNTTFILDALNNDEDPLRCPCPASDRAEADEVRARGLPMIFPASDPDVLDQRHIEKFVVTLLLRFARQWTIQSEGASYTTTVPHTAVG